MKGSTSVRGNRNANEIKTNVDNKGTGEGVMYLDYVPVIQLRTYNTERLLSLIPGARGIGILISVIIPMRDYRVSARR